MISKAFVYAVALASFVIASSASSANVGPAARQFIFAATKDGPASVATTTTTPPTAPPAEIAVEGEDMGAAMMGTLEEDPITSTEPLLADEPANGDVPEIAYNIGGSDVKNGNFEADPTDYIFGETSAFEIEDAKIGGADLENIDIYKSHRYGMLGSTWGYDIPVETSGYYNCTLHYAETYSEFFHDEANRTFSVEVSGDGSEEVQTVKDMDVMIDLNGAEFTALTKTFGSIAINSLLKIRETPSTGDAFLSGITCKYLSPLE